MKKAIWCVGCANENALLSVAMVTLVSSSLRKLSQKNCGKIQVELPTSICIKRKRTQQGIGSIYTKHDKIYNRTEVNTPSL